MLRTFNTTIMAFLLAIALSMIMVLFLPFELHNRLLLTVVCVAPIWLGIALWVTQKNNMKRMLAYLTIALIVMAGLIAVRLAYGS
ncbi:hypothetical protein [Kangiella taiwanensis]|uniref:hypothetical protein n=1 Tax=Kangiella taiwanensis TaxID=1079179 RepID=UPI001CBE81E0|nr:hypothetical protein [Kangiella taiwanensis]